MDVVFPLNLPVGRMKDKVVEAKLVGILQNAAHLDAGQSKDFAVVLDFSVNAFLHGVE